MSDEQNAKNSYANSQNTGNRKDTKLLAYKNEDISAETQVSLNTPTKHDEPLDPKDVEFLNMVMEKVDKGEIDLYRPATLLNYPVYDKLDEMAKGRADYDAMNLLSTIREIRKLWSLGHHDTYQIENLAHRIRVTKERLEQLGGDIYII
jgi:hypothetical protein